MESIPLLRDLVVLVAIAIPAVMLAHRLRIPTIVGFLLTGVLIGPNELAFVRDVETVTELAEMGSVLLFAVGLELSLAHRRRRYVSKGTIRWWTIGGSLIAVVAGLPVNHAVSGSLIALSSAIILKVYADRGGLDSAHGRVVVAILLFQDLCVVPLMVLLPLLAVTEQVPMAVVKVSASRWR